MKVRLKPIDEQVVVVMGASSGIGRETALRLARRGARVVAAARGPEGLASLVEAIRREGGEATSIVAEVTDFADVTAVAERAVATYGYLDTWVHVSGVGLWAPVSETTPEEWRRVLDVNLNGQAYGVMAALPHLRRTGRGALIHVSSIEAQNAVPYQAAYSASKHGLHGFLKALRLELAHERLPVSVTEIMPYATNTPIFDQGRSKIGVNPRPLPPIYDPGIVADAILYAAAHPTREMILSGIGQMGLLLQGVAPRLVDAILMLTAFRGQRTRERKAPDAPSNLYQPLAAFNRQSVSRFARETVPSSRYVWLLTHPAAKRAVGLALIGALACVLAQRRSGRTD